MALRFINGKWREMKQNGAKSGGMRINRYFFFSKYSIMIVGLDYDYQWHVTTLYNPIQRSLFAYHRARTEPYRSIFDGKCQTSIIHMV